MSMGREGDRQGDLMVTWAEMPRTPGHVFYDRLQEVLIAGDFDSFVETACQRYYAPKMGAPSVPPGRYFRMHMVGYFEGIASERGIAWRCSDSMSLRDFLRLENREEVPDHSWLSKTRGWPLPSARMIKDRLRQRAVKPLLNVEKPGCPAIADPPRPPTTRNQRSPRNASGFWKRPALVFRSRRRGKV
jgi:hypothetical protein